MDNTVELFLIRHGQCAANVQNLFVGHLDDKLTDDGTAQAALLHRTLKKMQIAVDAVFTSTALRAIQTAKIVFPDQALQSDSRLLEVNAGSLAAKKNSPPINYQDYLHRVFPEGESYSDMYRRVCEWFHSIVFEPGKKIAIVAHGGSLCMLMLHILHDHPGHFPLFQLDNASMTHIVTTPDRNKYFFKRINYSPQSV